MDPAEHRGTGYLRAAARALVSPARARPTPYAPSLADDLVPKAKSAIDTTVTVAANLDANYQITAKIDEQLKLSQAVEKANDKLEEVRPRRPSPQPAPRLLCSRLDPAARTTPRRQTSPPSTRRDEPSLSLARSLAPPGGSCVMGTPPCLARMPPAPPPPRPPPLPRASRRPRRPL